MTNSKLATRSFQTKAIPPALLKACDYVMQVNFQITDIAGSVNTVTGFHSSLKITVVEKILLKMREDIQTTQTDVTISSSDVAQK